MRVADGAVPQFRQPAHQLGPSPHHGGGGTAPGRGEQWTRAVRPAGEQLLLGRGRVPLRPGRAVGRQLGGAGVRRRAQPVRRAGPVGGPGREPVGERGRGTGAGQRPGVVQQRGEPLPGGLQDAGQRTVGRAPAVRCGGGVDGAADQRAAETEPALGEREECGHRFQTRRGRGGGPQVPYGVQDEVRVDVRGVRRPGGRRHRQQQVPYLRRQPRQGPARHVLQGARVGQGSGRWPVSAQFGGRQAADQGEQQGRVALRLGQQTGAHGRVGGAVGRVVQQGVGLRRRQRVQAYGGQVGELRVHGPVSGHGEEQADPARRVQAPGGAAQGGPVRRAPQVRVVHAHEQRAVPGRRPQSGEQFLGPQRCAPVRPGAEAQYGTGREGVGGPLEEGGAAEPGLPGHHQVAGAGAQSVQQRLHRSPLRAAAVDPHGRTYGRLSGHSREVTRA